MKQYIIIEADTNDGDYITEVTEISDEQVIQIKEILSKMPKTKNHLGVDLNQIPYKIRNIGKDDREDSNYNHISFEEKEILSKFLPCGDPDYPGIHTITEVSIVKLLEKIL